MLHPLVDTFHCKYDNHHDKSSIVNYELLYELFMVHMFVYVCVRAAVCVVCFCVCVQHIDQCILFFSWNVAL